MNNGVMTSVVILPGIVALLIFLLFTYLYEQSRQSYFRAWQIAWGAYCVHYGLDAWNYYRAPSQWAFFVGALLLVGMAVCIFVSTRLIRERFRLRWYEFAIAAAGTGLTVWAMLAQAKDGVFRPGVSPQPHLTVEAALGLVLLYSSFQFYRYAHEKGSLAFKLLAIALALWAVLMGLGQFQNPFLSAMGGGHLLGPIPQMLLGIAMVMVLFENERNAVQENALSFSTLGVDPMRLLSAADLAPAMQDILDRLVAPLPTNRAAICISERWRAVLPSAQLGFSSEFVTTLDMSGAGEYVCELAYRRGGFATFRSIADMPEPLPVFPGGRFEQFR